MPKKNQSKQDAIERELADLNDSAGSLMESAHCKSAFQLYGELRSRAKSEGHLAYYVFGTFFQMNLAQRLLQFETVRERAVELIALFEDEEQARKIEPSLDLEQYNSMIYSMGACAYEVLAEATGELDGFNSEGMQECLTGGIEVCHRIGKLSCVQCFREYACDIHTAADDYELARYHSNQVLQHEADFPERGDRRWLAMLRLAKMDILEGHHDSARSKLESATKLAIAKSVTDSAGAQISVMFERYTLDLLENREIDERTAETLAKLPPRGECPDYDLALDSVSAVGLVKQGEWEQAEKLLITWNKSLKQSRAITKWLETGVRLVALVRLRGDLTKAKRICIQFEDAATKANDWQTIRRLNQALDDSVDITPIATIVKSPRATPFSPLTEPERLASKWDKVSRSDVEPEDKTVLESSTKRQNDPVNPSESPRESSATTTTPLASWMDQLTIRMREPGVEGNEADQDGLDTSSFRSELMQKDVALFSHPEDIGRALYLVNFLITPESDRVAVWKWANRLVASHQDVGYLISLLGRLGMTISMIDRLTAEMARELSIEELDDFEAPDQLEDLEELSEIDPDFDGTISSDGRDDTPEEFLDRNFASFLDEMGAETGREYELSDSSISNERLDQLVRKSLQIDSKSVNNNFRAAEVFEYIGNAGEAERCYARTFKLDRTRDDAALALSRIYSESDRIQDALYVLDLCIREGGDSAELLFEAALKAHALTQYELQVSYLQKLHARYAPTSWTYYYLSSGLLELKRPQEALEAIEKEVALFGSAGLHIDSVRAAAFAQLGQSDRAVNEIKLALAHNISEIDDLTISGISGAYERLISAVKTCPDEKGIQTQVEERMLKAGIATESFFEQARSNEKPCDLYLYQCLVLQPLDMKWPDYEGCFANQTEWDAYLAQWGVLARDEHEAEETVLQWQRKCYDLEPEIADIQVDDELLHDRPGIAFQGARFPESEDEDDDDDDFGGDDDGNNHGDHNSPLDDREPF